jgi:hypothetical protein
LNGESIDVPFDARERAAENLHRITMPKSDGHDHTESTLLKGWHQIATFLGEPVSVVKRWASEGMPVRRQGRLISTTPEELNSWLGKESSKPVHIATEESDLTSELKRGLSFVRGKTAKTKKTA